MRRISVILIIGFWILGAGLIRGNDRTDFSDVNYSTWIPHYESNWGARSGYWGAAFIPMQALRDLDNQTLALQGSRFTIEQLLANSKKSKRGSYDSSLSDFGGEVVRGPRRLGGSGVTFQDYNAVYESGGQLVPSNTTNSSPMPLSELIVPQPNRR